MRVVDQRIAALPREREGLVEGLGAAFGEPFGVHILVIMRASRPVRWPLYLIRNSARLIPTKLRRNGTPGVRTMPTGRRFGCGDR